LRERYGFKSRSLEFLLYRRHRLFYDAHSAEADCQALLHLLAEPFEDAARPMRLLLEGARRKTVRIWAVGSPIEQKDMLKARRYRFNGGQDGRPKAWYRELPEGEESEAELAWLRENIYGGREGWQVERLDPRTRYARG
jgi:DNA polymerase-3 subunit epsilon